MQIQNRPAPPQPETLLLSNPRQRYIRRHLWRASPIPIALVQPLRIQLIFTVLIRITKIQLSGITSFAVNHISAEEPFLIILPIYFISVLAEKLRKGFSRHRTTETRMVRRILYRRTTISIPGPTLFLRRLICFSGMAGRLRPD